MDNEYGFVADLTATSTIWGRVNASSKEEAKELIELGEWNQLDDNEPDIESSSVEVSEKDIELLS